MRTVATLVLLLIFGVMGGFAATVTVSANTNWSAITTGSGLGGLPSSADAVVVGAAAGPTLTVDVSDAVCASIKLGIGGTGEGTISFNSGSQVTVSSLVTLGDGTGGNKRNGNLSMTNGGTLICQGLAYNQGTFTPGAGTVEITTTYTIPNSPNFDIFNNLRINGGTTTLGRTTTLTGDLTIITGTLNTSNKNITLNGGSWTNNGGTLSGTGTVTFSKTTGGQTIGGAATTSFYGLTISNTSAAGVASSSNFNVSVGGTMTVSTGALFIPDAAVVINAGGAAGTITGAGTVRVTRTADVADYSSQYKFTTNTLTNLYVEYAGAAAQSVNGLTYGNLTINNSSGVTLGGATTVNGTLTLTTGLLSLGSNNLTLGASATVAGNTPSASNMIVTNSTGEVRKTFAGTGPFTFPIGEITGTTEYSPATLDFKSGIFDVGAYAGVRVTDAKHPENTSANHYLTRYWTVTASGISSFSCDATFAYIGGAADVQGTESLIMTGAYNGVNWALYDPAIVADHKLSALGVASFSDFTGGEEAALPVKVANLSALMVSSSRVEVTWTTISETNNYGFEVQKSAGDLEHYQTIPGSFKAGQGTSLISQQYSYTDESATPGVWYYRLKQIDLDGAFHYSEGVRVSVLTDVVEIAPVKFALMQNYPNPFNPETEIGFSVESTGKATLRVYNLLGQEVATLFDAPAESGRYYHVRFGGAGLPSGTYIYRLNSGQKVATMRMVLLK